MMTAAFQQVAENQQRTWIFFAAAVMLLVIVIGLTLFSALFLLRPWLRAWLSGVPVTLIQLVGMYFRRSPVSRIIDCGIMAAHGGHGIPWAELEYAALQKVDLELVTSAWVENMKGKLGLTWDEIISAARHSSLEKLLGGRHPRN